MPNNLEHKNSEIAVLDAGGQYCHLIARKIREIGAKTEIFSPGTSPEKLRKYCGIVISGGPSSVYEPESPKVDKGIFSLGIPILGICYGHQLIAYMLGGTVRKGKVGEYGISKIKISSENGLFKGLNKEETVWMSHMDTVESPPPGFSILGYTKECKIAAMGNINKKFFSVQFHPEVVHTPRGKEILGNFVSNICKCSPKWNPLDKIDPIKKEIKEKAKNKSVFFFVSGGVDSTVAFTIALQALGKDRIRGYYVNTGFMRKNESEKVRYLYEEKLGVKIQIIDAENEFFNNLKGEWDPEKKRKIIGNKFIEIQEKTIRTLNNVDNRKWILGQGTIYPDTIESGGTESSSVIKTHHNRVDLIKDLMADGRLIEPLSDFYKDEVRLIGKKIGLPDDVIYKHPFPGPGLATRTLCSPNDISVEKSDKAIQRLLRPLNLKSWILPIRSVGVQGDKRTYENVLIVAGKADIAAVQKVSTTVTNNIMRVNRVAYMIKPTKLSFASLKIKRSFLTKERVDLLREIDDIVMKSVEKHGLIKKIWQFPIILLPLSSNGGEFIVLRPIHSVDGMTAQVYELPKPMLKELCEYICNIKGIDGILYDVTNKPPATIEWE